MTSLIRPAKRSRAVLHPLLLVVLSATVHAQITPVPDSMAAQMISPGLFRLLDYQIAQAAFGFRQVVKLELPPGAAWSRVAAHVMQAVNGRAPTLTDSLIMVFAVRDVRWAADTLFASISAATDMRCDDGSWSSSGTNYHARTHRVGSSWTRVELTYGVTWDGACFADDEQLDQPDTAIGTLVRIIVLDSMNAAGRATDRVFVPADSESLAWLNAARIPTAATADTLWCPASGSTDHPHGYRVSISISGDGDTRILSLTKRCTNIFRSRRRGFYEAMRAEIKRENNRWRIARVIDRAIT